MGFRWNATVPLLQMILLVSLPVPLLKKILLVSCQSNETRRIICSNGTVASPMEMHMSMSKRLLFAANHGWLMLTCSICFQHQWRRCQHRTPTNQNKKETASEPAQNPHHPRMTEGVLMAAICHQSSSSREHMSWLQYNNTPE